MWSVLGGKWSFSAKSAAKRWCSVVPSLSGAPPAPSLIANAGSSSRSLTEKTRLGPEAKDWSDVYGRTASPLYADLSGLPPLLIVVGGNEALLDDSVRLARSAGMAGVDVTLYIGAGMQHIFPIYCGAIPEADAAIAMIGEWIGSRTSRASEV